MLKKKTNNSNAKSHKIQHSSPYLSNHIRQPLFVFPKKEIQKEQLKEKIQKLIKSKNISQIL